MTDLRRLDDDELGRALEATAGMIDWPDDRSFAADLGDLIRERERQPSLARPRLSLPSRRRTIVVVIVALVLLAGAAVAAKLVIDLGALTLESVPGLPTAVPSVPAGSADFGKAVTLDEAAAIAGFRPLVPQALGAPDRVWIDEAVTAFETSDKTTRVVMAWLPDARLPRIPGTLWGAVAMEFDGSVDLAAKVVYAATGTIRHAIVGGADAYWVSGPHELRLLGPSGLKRYLVTGNVLLWNEAGIVVRLETALGKRAAIAIAGSI